MKIDLCFPQKIAEIGDFSLIRKLRMIFRNTSANCGDRKIFLNPQIAELPHFLPQELAEIGDFSLIRNLRKSPPLKGRVKTSLLRGGGFRQVPDVQSQLIRKNVLDWMAVPEGGPK